MPDIRKARIPPDDFIIATVFFLKQHIDKVELSSKYLPNDF